MTTEIIRENDENYINITLGDFTIAVNDIIEEINYTIENNEDDVDLMKEVCEDALTRFEIRATELIDVWDRYEKYPKNVIEATEKLAEYIINGLRDDIAEALIV